MHKRLRGDLLLFAICLLGARSGLADSQPSPLEFTGHAKYQLTHGEYRKQSLANLFGPQSTTDENLDIRLNLSERFPISAADLSKKGSWDTQLHYEMLGVHGDAFGAQTRARRSIPTSLSVGTLLPDDRRRLLPLSIVSRVDADTALVNRLDRFAIGYTNDRVGMRLGRQAVSWGNGLLFQTLDPFNPFAPTAIDKEYKSGDDMLSGQLLFEDGSDLQAIVIPRREPSASNINRLNVTGGSIESDQSTYAARYQRRVEPIDAELQGVLAQHYDQAVVGAGISKSIFDAVARADIAYTDLSGSDAGEPFSFLANVDRSWDLFGKNFYTLVEYFHSGVGVDSADYVTLRKSLIDGLGRGELFTLGQDYLGVGLRLEATPLTNIFGNAILNLNDSSGVLQLRMQYDWSDNLNLICGLNVPYGGKGSEFGGVVLPIPGESVVLAPGKEIYLRVAYYFRVR